MRSGSKMLLRRWELTPCDGSLLGKIQLQILILDSIQRMKSEDNFLSLYGMYIPFSLPTPILINLTHPQNFQMLRKEQNSIDGF